MEEGATARDLKGGKVVAVNDDDEVTLALLRDHGDNNDDDDDREDDDDQDDDGTCVCCTHAVTGNIPSFQAIFVCHACFENDQLDEDEEVEEEEEKDTAAAVNSHQHHQQGKTPLCICQGCANACHDGDFHDVEYIGMGPSYCDCHCMNKCHIYEKSLVEAARLGLQQDQAVLSKETKNEPLLDDADDHDSGKNGVMHQIFDIESLQDETVATYLVQQAHELIRHTKETHWIDRHTIELQESKLCSFENLAWNIYKAHCGRFKVSATHDDGEDDHSAGGAEWWVQVKETTSVANVDNGSPKKSSASSTSTSSIDLHYDKDEALAESFGLGSFPTLSTVTYLTPATLAAAPTIVLDHTYTQGEEEVMSTMLVSRPRVGKHLVFDGRMLHGAPSSPLLLQTVNDDTKAVNSDGNGSFPNGTDGAQEARGATRVTFLVNIWNHRKPANVMVLDSEIRQKLLEGSNIDSTMLLVEMTPQSIPVVSVNKEEDLPEKLRRRIELPFVSKGTQITWENELDQGMKGAVNDNEDQDDEDDSGLVVVTFPPPPFDGSGALLIRFAAGMQAYLDYLQGTWDNAAERDRKEDKDNARTPRKSDYV